jgi:hypothetical protein
MQQQTIKRTTVDIDTRRTVAVLARSRKPQDVAREGHESFIRNALKDRMGWPKREHAPESIKQAAKEMAAYLVKRDAEIAALKAKNKAEADAKKAKEEAEAAKD